MPSLNALRKPVTDIMRTLLYAGTAVLLVFGLGFLAWQQVAPADEHAEPADHAAADTPEGTRPLISLMVALGQDVSRVNDGIWREDFEMVRLGAHAIAAHPRVTPEEMEAIKGALGDQFTEFVQFDGLVHGRAEQLAEAAAEQNMDRVLALKIEMENGCVNCHATFRGEVRQALRSVSP